MDRSQILLMVIACGYVFLLADVVSANGMNHTMVNKTMNHNNNMMNHTMEGHKNHTMPAHNNTDHNNHGNGSDHMNNGNDDDHMNHGNGTDHVNHGNGTDHVNHGNTDHVNHGNGTDHKNHGNDSNHNTHNGNTHGASGHSTGHATFFATSEHLTLFFQKWTSKTRHEFLVMCVVLAVLGIAYEGVKLIRQFVTKAQISLKSSKSDFGSRSSSPFGQMLLHLFQTLLYIIQVFIGYLLMLGFMTYNTYICVSIMVGFAVGYLCFGWVIPVYLINGEHDTCCN